MEIRRCDKCDSVIDAKIIEPRPYIEDLVGALRIPLVFVKPSTLLPKTDQEGLDDRDEFGNSLICKDVDLCEACAPNFIATVGRWFSK